MRKKYLIKVVDELPSKWKNPMKHSVCIYKGAVTWIKTDFGNLTRRRCKRCGYCEYYPAKLDIPSNKLVIR